MSKNEGAEAPEVVSEQNTVLTSAEQAAAAEPEVAADADGVDLNDLKAVMGLLTEEVTTTTITEPPVQKSAEPSNAPVDNAAVAEEEIAPIEEPEPLPPQLKESLDQVVTLEPANVDDAVPISASCWEDLQLPEDVIKGIRAKGFERPSKVQSLALPLLRAGKNDMIAQAKNGSGKTAAFSLAMLLIVDRDCRHAQALCVCPTRELAQQNLAVIDELGKFTGITAMTVVPGAPKYPSSGKQLLCGTPGKLVESLQKRYFPTQYMKMFVLDEADVMVDRAQSMATQVADIRKFFKQRLQLVLFSATYPDEVRSFAEKMCKKPNKITVKREMLTLKSVQQFCIVCREQSKYAVLDLLYGSMSIGQSVIFVKSRKGAFELARRMKDDGHGVSLICGTQTKGPEKMEHSHREQVMTEFREGRTKVLVATDVMSRGIDVPAVTLVVNYDLPVAFNPERWRPPTINMETYMHRVGRTGRFGLKGIAVNLVTDEDFKMISEIEAFFQCHIPELPLDPEMIQEMVAKLRT